MGMAPVSGLPFRRRAASQPSTTGISRSIRIKSGRSLIAASHPFSPSPATNTSNSSGLEPHLEHVDVVLVVFDIENADHEWCSLGASGEAEECTSRRMRSTSTLDWKESLTSTCVQAPEPQRWV